MKQYIDATYLKDFSNASITDEQHKTNVLSLVSQAINYQLKLVMVSPKFVSIVRKQIDEAKSKVLVGTVIDFPFGTSEQEVKLAEAQRAIDLGADELDFVINYKAFKKGDVNAVKSEVLNGTAFCLKNHKKVKWIIETAALTEKEIIQICVLIKNVVISNFLEKDYQNVFVKSSTGFFVTENGAPNGATRDAIIMMLENASPLPIKASGGIRNYQDALNMVNLGVQRIGTSAVLEIINQENYTNDVY